MAKKLIILFIIAVPYSLNCMEPEPTKTTASQKIASSISATQKTKNESSDENIVDSLQKMDIDHPEAKKETTTGQSTAITQYPHGPHFFNKNFGPYMKTPWGIMFK